MSTDKTIVSESLKVSGLVELEASYSKDQDQSEASDIVLATGQRNFEKRISKISSGFISLLYEEGDTELEVEEAFVELTYLNDIVSIKAGKMFTSFGIPSSELISDPMTQELSELNDSAVQIGLSLGPVKLEAFTLAGKTSPSLENPKVKNHGVRLGIEHEGKLVKSSLSADYLYSLADTDLLSDVIPDSNSDGLKNDLIQVPGGLSLMLNLECANFFSYTAYLKSLGRFSANDIAFNGQPAQIELLTTELGYKSTINGREIVLSTSYQESKGAIGLELPRARKSFASSYQLDESTVIAYEIMDEHNYETSDCSNGTCGSGGSVLTHTLQLGLEF